MNKIICIFVFMSFVSILPGVINATDKAASNNYADLLQQDTIGMTKAKMEVQFNPPSKLYDDSDLGQIWEYNDLHDPGHPENKNSTCRVYFQQDKVHHVACSKN